MKNAPNMPCTKEKVDKSGLEQLLVSSLHTLLQILPQMQGSVGESDFWEELFKNESDKFETRHGHYYSGWHGIGTLVSDGHYDVT